MSKASKPESKEEHIESIFFQYSDVFYEDEDSWVIGFESFKKMINDGFIHVDSISPHFLKRIIQMRSTQIERRNEAEKLGNKQEAKNRETVIKCIEQILSMSST